MPRNKCELPLNVLAIQRKRKILGLTQRQAAELAQISHSMWASIENGSRAPSLETLRRIAIVLKLPLSVLVPDLYDTSQVD